MVIPQIVAYVMLFGFMCYIDYIYVEAMAGNRYYSNFVRAWALMIPLSCYHQFDVQIAIPVFYNSILFALNERWGFGMLKYLQILFTVWMVIAS